MDEPNARNAAAESMIGILAAVFTVGPAIYFAFEFVESFIWSCSGAPCFFQSSTVEIQDRIGGLSLLVIVLALSQTLQFLFIAALRPFLTRNRVEGTFLRYSMPMLKWHDKLLDRWIAWLWSR